MTEQEKPITFNQRKILDKIFAEKFKIAKETKKKERMVEANKETEKIEKQYEQIPEIKKAIKTAKKFIQEWHECQQILAENQISISGLSQWFNGRNTVGVELKYTNPKAQEINDKTQKVYSDLSTKENEFRAVIYGMEATYSDLAKKMEEFINN
jgi:hypothetical protein